jgi:hypothetical protein
MTAATECVTVLYRNFPGFDLADFVEGLPYSAQSYSRAIAGPLRQAVEAV